MVVRCKAPLRISFAGGGTDVDPYRTERGGCVLSTTIDKYVYASCRPRKDRTIQVQSVDYDIVAKYNTATDMIMDGELDLVKAVINELRGRRSKRGFDLFLQSDAPPGSGLGSSSTLVVGLVSLFKEYFKRPMTAYEVAELAYRIERVDLGLKGGMQDQYAAVFGGFNFIEFDADKVVVNPLRLDVDVINELHYNLLLCYTGQTRTSEGIIDAQVNNFRKGIQASIHAMDQLKDLCVDMKNALLRRKLALFAELLDASWQAKKEMASGITNPRIDEMYNTARKAGAVGGKILGAGGGGYLLVYAPFTVKHRVAERLETSGGQVVDFNFDFQGAVTWRIPD
jgi:D-glycero-alpha-D-manno-heptose-7-phosphate kinase